MKRAQYDAQFILNRSYDLFEEGGFDKREGSSSSQGLQLLSYPYLSPLPVPRRTLQSSS